ncbi:MAG: hypothetical protein H7246_07845, partial [Phycisphaerae bacterium]|nr:hypothetical protein [Saprospiraceae bacterium]
MAVSSYIPLTYAVKANGTLHLFVLVYGNQAEEPDYPKQGQPSGATMLYAIKPAIINHPIGQTPFFQY